MKTNQNRPVRVSAVFAVVCTVFSLGMAGCGSRCEDAKEKVIEPVNHVTDYLKTNPTGQQLAQESCDDILLNLNGLPEGADNIRAIARDKYENSYSVCTQYATSFRVVCNHWYFNDSEAEAIESEIQEEATEDAIESVIGATSVESAEHSLMAEISADVAAAEMSFEMALDRNPPARKVGNPPAPRPPVRRVQPSRPPRSNPSNPVVIVRPRPPRPIVRPIPRYGYPRPGRPVVPVCRRVAYSYCANYEYRHERNDPMFNQAMDLARDLDTIYFKANEMCELAYAQKHDEARQKSQELLGQLQSQILPNGRVFYQNACGID